MKVAVVAGNECLRTGLASMLSSLPAVQVVDSSDGHCGEWIFDPDVADLVILRFCPFDADATSRLARAVRDSRIKLLLLLDEYTEDMIDTLATIPSDGFLLGDITTERLRIAVEGLAHGDVLSMPAPMARTLMTRVGTVQSMPTGAALTPREREVLALMVEGLSNKEIAKQLSISPNGVKRLVSCVLAKLNCSNRTQTVALALNSGLLD